MQKYKLHEMLVGHLRNDPNSVWIYRSKGDFWALEFRGEEIIRIKGVTTQEERDQCLKEYAYNIVKGAYAFFSDDE